MSIKTALHDWHVRLGGKLVDFAGHRLPVTYPLGLVKEHKWTRSAASLFDVSHMGQLKMVDDEKFRFSVVGDVAKLGVRESMLSLITLDDGGIVDDTIIQRVSEDELFVVVNGACKDKDVAHLKASGCEFEVLKDVSLLALQGPKAVDVLMRQIPQVSQLKFMQGDSFRFGNDGFDVRVTRCGYTGEDGFEISVSNEHAEHVADVLVASEDVEPAGLGARDSLRLEAGLCLYGNDLTEKTTPIEGNLNWTIPKHRRASGAFRGADAIVEQISSKPFSKRVGLTLPKGCGIPRQGMEVSIGGGDGGDVVVVGTITSGSFSPTLGHPIAMAYLEKPHYKLKTQVNVKVRKSQVPATVVKMPWVAPNYHK